MLVLIQVVNGSQVGRKMQLRGGEHAIVGRTELSDFSFSDYYDLADQHFEIDCRSPGSILVRGLGSAITRVNGEEVSSHPLQSGDQINAGSLELVVTFDRPNASSQEESVPAEVESDSDEPPNLFELCVFLGLGPEVIEMAAEHVDPETLIDSLIQAESYHAALRLRAHTLSNQEAVWWACSSLRELDQTTAASGKSMTALDSAEAWALDSKEETRRACEHAPSVLESDDPAGLIAYAAFCGGGSIAPPDVESDLEPDERVCGAMTAGALTIVGHRVPNDAAERFECIFRKGKDLFQGRLTLPAAMSEPEDQVDSSPAG